ncbi:MAG TPA: hypothetical protein VGM77_07695 [Gemmatimonadales bacterium]
MVWQHAITTTQLLQSIASSVLGVGASHEGMAAAWLGAAIHYGVALGWTAVFIALIRWWPSFRRLLASPSGTIKAGFPFGMAVWLLMNFLIVPHTRHGTAASISTAWFWGCLVWHAVGVGWPMALIMRPTVPDRD